MADPLLLLIRCVPFLRHSEAVDFTWRFDALQQRHVASIEILLIATGHTRSYNKP